MPNNPYDDLLKNLLKLLEQITTLEHHMHKFQDDGEKKPSIIGCAIITGGSLGGGLFDDGRSKRSDALPYEMIDNGMTAFLTIQLPSGVSDDPQVIFQTDECHINAGGLSGTISLKFPIIPETSTWSYHNGILDVTLSKLPLKSSEASESDSGDNPDET